MKKRGLALLMALALTLSLAACGGTEETPDDTADTAEEETIPSGGEADLAEEETPEEETPEEDGTTEAIDEIEKEETDEPEMGSGTADPAQKPQTGTAPADPNVRCQAGAGAAVRAPGACQRKRHGRPAARRGDGRRHGA